MQAPQDSLNLTYVGKFLPPGEAALLAAELEEQGIESQVVNEELTTWLSYYGSAIGGARLMVPMQHAEAAKRLLAEHEAARKTGEEAAFPAGFDFGDDTPTDVSEAVQSPSNQERLRHAYRVAIIGIMLFYFPISLYVLYLIIRDELWQKEELQGWRLYTTFLLGLLSFGLFLRIWMSFFG